MSTSYYLLRIPTKEHKQEVINAIMNDAVDILRDLSYESLYSVKEIGHRAGGWQFSWNPFLEGIKKFTKDEIVNIVNQDDVVIYDEYYERQDKKEFLDMAFNWCTNGWTSKTYHEDLEHRTEYVPDMSRTLSYLVDLKNNNESWKIIQEKAKPSLTDFIHDGLRWSLLFEYR